MLHSCSLALDLIAVGDRVLFAASQLDPVTIRSLDAINVATALPLRSRLGAFVSDDQRQLEAAEALGLPVASPR